MRTLIFKASFVICNLLICAAFYSCTSYKTLSYFQDLPDISKNTLTKTFPFQNPVIQNDDILRIDVKTIDNSVTSLLNDANTNAGAVEARTPPASESGYLVDKKGNVDLPFAGKIKVSGLTTAEAKDKIRIEIDKYFNNAVVNVRLINFKITVLGEVSKPSTYIVPNEKINIFDALGMAGDMTIYGRRENVLLVRDTSDEKKLIRLNLHSKDIVSSPYFYLKPNDIIYVEPNKDRIAGANATFTRNLAIFTALISAGFFILSRL